MHSALFRGNLFFVLLSCLFCHFSCKRVGNSSGDSSSQVSAASVLSTFPRSGAQNVAVDVVILASFSVTMDSTSINQQTFTLWKGEEQISGSVLADSFVANLSPHELLEYSTAYRVLLSADILDSDGRQFVEDYEWEFTTRPIPKLEILTTSRR